jgi:hypothetical protein
MQEWKIGNMGPTHAGPGTVGGGGRIFNVTSLGGLAGGGGGVGATVRTIHTFGTPAGPVYVMAEPFAYPPHGNACGHSHTHVQVEGPAHALTDEQRQAVTQLVMGQVLP